jgi:hypothetical protein
MDAVGDFSPSPERYFLFTVSGFSALRAEKPDTDDSEVPCCRRQIDFKREASRKSYE